jgi:hypothetical protein
MKRNILTCLTLLFSITIWAQSKPEPFLHYLFDGATSETIVTSMVNNSKQALVVAKSGTVGGEEIYQKGIVYSEGNEKQSIYLLVLGPYIFGADGRMLLDVSRAPGVFWGWRISIAKNSGREIGIHLDWFADEGGRTTDAILLLWDSKANSFRVWTIDPSQD